MSTHVPTGSTPTVEINQIAEINRCLDVRHGSVPIRAVDLGLTGTVVRPDALDRVVLSRTRLPSPTEPEIGIGELTPDLRLRSVIAAGPPDYPYLYGVFGEVGAHGNDRLLAAALHTDHLRTISTLLRLRHRWGV